MKYIVIVGVFGIALWLSRGYSDYCKKMCESKDPSDENYISFCEAVEKNKKVVFALLFGACASIAIILM